VRADSRSRARGDALRAEDRSRTTTVFADISYIIRPDELHAGRFHVIGISSLARALTPHDWQMFRVPLR
jgi:hypothetical protein